MATMAAETPDVPPSRLAVPSRNPLPLSASQESQVRDIYYARVRKHCADEIKGMRNPIDALYTAGCVVLEGSCESGMIHHTCFPSLRLELFTEPLLLKMRN